MAFQNKAFNLRRWALIFLVGTSFNFAKGVEEIKPPFGLKWGESAERLEKLLKSAKATIVEKRIVEKRDAWTVEGLVQQDLQRTIFYFKSNMLVEIELQYQNASWDLAKYDDFMAQIRRRVEQKYGVGKLMVRSKTPEGEIMQTVVGYQWTLNNTAIQLFYFAAENASQNYRTISVHYKIN